MVSEASISATYIHTAVYAEPDTLDRNDLGLRETEDFNFDRTAKCYAWVKEYHDRDFTLRESANGIEWELISNVEIPVGSRVMIRNAQNTNFTRTAVRIHTCIQRTGGFFKATGTEPVKS